GGRTLYRSSVTRICDPAHCYAEGSHYFWGSTAGDAASGKLCSIGVPGGGRRPVYHVRRSNRKHAADLAQGCRKIGAHSRSAESRLAHFECALEQVTKLEAYRGRVYTGRLNAGTRLQRNAREQEAWGANTRRDRVTPESSRSRGAG